LALVTEAGIEPALADPDRPASLLKQVADVAVITLLLGSLVGPPETIAAIHGPRLERLMEKLVDTPVRGVIYEAAGSVSLQQLETGRETVTAAGERWRIPVEILDRDPVEHGAWRDAALTATRRLLGA
jgi:hypothetical protein